MNGAQTLQIVGLLVVVSVVLIIVKGLLNTWRIRLIHERQRRQSAPGTVSRSVNSPASPPKSSGTTSPDAKQPQEGVTSIYRIPKDKGGTT